MMKCSRRGCKENLQFIKHLDIVDPTDNQQEIPVSLFVCDCGVQILLLPESHYEI